MKAKTKNTEECSTLFEIEVPTEQIKEAFEEVYNDIMKVANIPGFRTGKAPKEMVRHHYAKDAREEVLKRLIPEAYRKALSEHKVEAIGFPEITDVNFAEDKALSFKARVDTRPKFKLKNYKAIKIEKKKVSLKDEDVEKALTSLAELNARYTTEERPAEMHDYVITDMECFVDGKAIHKKRENLWFYIDKESLVPGLSENIIGMKKSEEKDVEVVLPEKYPDKNLAGKKARYHVLVKEVKLRKIPDINDEFAKELGKDTLEDLKKTVREELVNRAKVNADVDAENKLLNKLMDDNVFAVPSNFVKRQLEHMVEDAKRRLEQKGFSHEELDKKDAEFREKFKNDAVRHVRLLFVLDEIANSEHIEVNDKDVEAAYKNISLNVGKTESEVKDYYEKEELVDGLKDKIREEKTIKFLMDSADIVEVES